MAVKGKPRSIFVVEDEAPLRELLTGHLDGRGHRDLLERVDAAERPRSPDRLYGIPAEYPSQYS